MTSSLVGSEMCIRDRWKIVQETREVMAGRDYSKPITPEMFQAIDRETPVSYTHLTLPTICSV
eukprot:7821296-Prorocentrum_lima.AAC.1